MPIFAHERGYRSVVDRAELQRLGFSPAQRLVPGLLIPIYDVTGKIPTYQYRPDEPRINDGKPVKYETPPGSRMCIDVPRHITLAGWHKEAKRPLFITDGVRKTDAALSRFLCCIDLPSVWSWRARNEVVALPDWESIVLHRRHIYLVFDSDATSNPLVHAALEQLTAFLESRRAKVHIVYLPPGPSGAKVGLDDHLASEPHARVNKLVALAEDHVRPLVSWFELPDDDRPFVDDARLDLALEAGARGRRPIYASKQAMLDQLAEDLDRERHDDWFDVDPDPGLMQRFEILNRQLFDGQLPRCRVAYGPPHLLSNKHLGCTYRRRRLILIRRNADRATQEGTLKHEMIHLRVPGHGPAFRAELARLVERGDTWAAIELAALDPASTRLGLSLAIVAQEHPEWRWTTARAHLAFRYGLSVRELRRLAPWARNEWHRLTEKSLARLARG